jgi:hypothetical protein
MEKKNLEPMYNFGSTGNPKKTVLQKPTVEEIAKSEIANFAIEGIEINEKWAMKKAMEIATQINYK